VPFGTGRRTAEIAALRDPGERFELYAPALFRALGAVISGLEEFALSADLNALRGAISARCGELGSPVLALLERKKVFDALAHAATQAPAGPVLRRRVHTWFDALRTLRFIHLLRDTSLPPLHWRRALSEAPFSEGALRDGPDPRAVCAQLTEMEAGLPSLIGPTR